MHVSVRLLAATVAVAASALAPSAATAADGTVNGCSASHGQVAGVGIGPNPPYVQPFAATEASCSYVTAGGDVGWWCKVGPGGSATITVVTSNGPLSRTCPTGPSERHGILHDVQPESTVRVRVRFGDAQAWDCASIDCVVPDGGVGELARRL